jgi:hypothetical protein
MENRRRHPPANAGGTDLPSAFYTFSFFLPPFSFPLASGVVDEQIDAGVGKTPGGGGGSSVGFVIL